MASKARNVPGELEKRNFLLFLKILPSFKYSMWLIATGLQFLTLIYAERRTTMMQYAYMIAALLMLVSLQKKPFVSS